MFNQNYLPISEDAFIQQAVYYFSRGYFFYTHSEIPVNHRSYSDPEDLRLSVDLKLNGKYHFMSDKFWRARRKAQGLYTCVYLRYSADLVLFFNAGKIFQTEDGYEGEGNPFTDEDLSDVRKNGLNIFGYNIFMARGGRITVSITKERYKEFKAYFIEHAPKKSADWLLRELKYHVVEKFSLWGGVRKQIYTIIKAMNETRKTAGKVKDPKKDLVVLDIVKGHPGILPYRKVVKVWRVPDTTEKQKEKRDKWNNAKKKVWR